MKMPSSALKQMYLTAVSIAGPAYLSYTGHLYKYISLLDSHNSLINLLGCRVLLQDASLAVACGLRDLQSLVVVWTPELRLQQLHKAWAW